MRRPPGSRLWNRLLSRLKAPETRGSNFSNSAGWSISCSFQPSGCWADRNCRRASWGESPTASFHFGLLRENPLTHTTEFTYNAANLVLTAEDALGNIT